MIYLYPANKMENLLQLLNKIQQLSPLGVFNQEVIVVQNAAMQHWLNLSIAQHRNISMNTRYALPSQFLWKLIRTLSSDKGMPEKSLYSKEVLTWRIFQLLASKTVVLDEDFAQATVYWSGSKQDEVSLNPDNLKRYQLSGQLADLYEQYLVFRPQWLDSWQQGDFNVSDFTVSDFTDTVNIDEKNRENTSLLAIQRWQGKLWQLLNQQQEYNPVTLLANAIKNIPERQHLLPKRISFFGLNAMPPMWLNFISALSEHVEVHFFHLNPCFSYWGDILTEKQAVKKIAHWVDGYDDPHSFVGNPLLANFGQQGREFLALLQEYSTINIDVFEEANIKRIHSINKPSTLYSPINNSPINEAAQLSILSQIQNDILMLKDARETPCVLNDDSIVITSCHSALREVQGLHDYLLHQFNNAAQNNTNLTPKDILVMCPQIEQYAPYVNAVFSQGWQDIDAAVPPLPCSIADRSAKDSDVIIATFIELLTLPDSRFHVSQLLGFLRLPSMAQRFDINQDDLRKITVWLEKASIHWGLDLHHKQQVITANLKPDTVINNNFTWQQGLSRLLRGFAFSDSDVIYQDQLLLGDIEGDDAILLGKLLLIIEQLQQLSVQLLTPRTAQQWQRFLLQQLDCLFVKKSLVTNNSDVEQDNEASFVIIEQAISALVEYCYQGRFSEKIELAIIKDFLDQHFSQPDPGRQFMVGQVTFCSMLPMRSIPFKIIAVLGLNDGDFPRQRQSLGFDLMSLTSAKLGDRSRRGDDRYLFLEALISARQSLYLSYQGRSIKNNTLLDPSLVLKELMEYLHLGYGWNFSDENLPDNDLSNNDLSSNDIRQLAMQAFSEQNYYGKWASFDANWLTLGQNQPIDSTNNGDINNQDTLRTPEQTKLVIPNKSSALEKITLSANELIRFYQHPAKDFAQKQLNLYFDNNATLLSDSEPFTTDTLEVYLLREALLKQYLTPCLPEKNENIIKQVLYKAELSGKFPDFPTIEQSFENWQTESDGFSQYITEIGLDNPSVIDCHLSLTLDSSANELNLIAKLPIKTGISETNVVFYRSSSAKPKDLFTLYLHQLIIQVWQSQQICSQSNTTQDITTQDITTTDKNNVEHEQLKKVASTQGVFFDTKAQKVAHYIFSDLENAKSTLDDIIKYYYLGQNQALLLNGSLADEAFKLRRGKPKEMDQSSFMKYWQGSDNTSFGKGGNQTSMILGDDPYMQYFWSEYPQWDECKIPLQDVYQGLYKAVKKLKLVDVTSKEKRTNSNKGGKK